MRALRVVGITEGGGELSVVLEDPTRQERFTVPADEQLRAAARGDLTRLGQIAIELESQLRPREIQARIRAGASVDQVAAAAGGPSQKIERFAYPVLLERSRTAELALPISHQFFQSLTLKISILPKSEIAVLDGWLWQTRWITGGEPLIKWREFLVNGLRSIAASEGFTIEASDLGKFKMLVQILAVVAAIIDHRWHEWNLQAIGIPLFLPIDVIARTSIWFMVFISLVSAADYFVGFWSKIDRRVERRRRRLFVLRRRKSSDVAAS